MFFGIHGNATESPFYDKSRVILVVIDLREHDKHVGKTSVSDPHFLTVDEVVRTFNVQFRARPSRVRIRSSIGFGQAIGSLPLARRQLGDVFILLCIVAILQNGQRADAGVRRKCHRE